MYAIDLQTHSRTEFIEITDQVRAALAKSGLTDGAILVFVPHTTAGITINENADPDVVQDVLSFLEKTIPFEGDFLHGEGNSAAHIKTSYFGTSQHVIVEGGKLKLWTWQGIYFCEFDGPRRRQFWVQPLPAAHG